VSERKTTEIKLRVSPEEKPSWQLAAEQREVGLSQFIRDCVNLYPLTNPRPVESLLDSDDFAVMGLDAEVENSSVAQVVPTSVVADVVAKPWMFEARNGD